MPDWSRMPGALLWPLTAVSEVFRYCLHPTGGLLSLLAVLGALWMLRNKQHRLLVLMVAPLLGAMVTSHPSLTAVDAGSFLQATRARAQAASRHDGHMLRECHALPSPVEATGGGSNPCVRA